MPAEDFLADLAEAITDRSDIVWEKRGILRYSVAGAEKIYDSVRIISKDIKPDDKIIFIRAGVHGEEIAGPMTMALHINEIIDYAHKNKIKVIIYPLVNPSGFEFGRRYNVLDYVADEGTDDMMRYQLDDGSLSGELAEGQKFIHWYFSDDERVGADLTEEAKLMHKELKTLPVWQIGAMVDLHQDYITPDVRPAAYHYGFGDLSRYVPIVKKIEQLVPVLRNVSIDAGYDTPCRSDDLGFIVRHDGSLLDVMHRMKVGHCITVETMGITPLKIADKINMIWIKGLIDLVAKEG
jgi:hypothetical protein